MFTQRDKKFVLAMCEALGKGAHGQWFRGVSEADINFDSINAENDLMYIKDCSVFVQEQEVPAIIPRKQRVFIPQVPVVVPGGHWEPDDVDLIDLRECQSLAEAISELYLQEASQFCADTAMAVGYEAEQQEEV